MLTAATDKLIRSYNSLSRNINPPRAAMNGNVHVENGAVVNDRDIELAAVPHDEAMAVFHEQFDDRLHEAEENIAILMSAFIESVNNIYHLKSRLYNLQRRPEATIRSVNHEFVTFNNRINDMMAGLIFV